MLLVQVVEKRLGSIAVAMASKRQFVARKVADGAGNVEMDPFDTLLNKLLEERSGSARPTCCVAERVDEISCHTHGLVARFVWDRESPGLLKDF